MRFSPSDPGFESQLGKFFFCLRFALYCLVHGQLRNRNHLVLKKCKGFCKCSLRQRPELKALQKTITILSKKSYNPHDCKNLSGSQTNHEWRFPGENRNTIPHFQNPSKEFRSVLISLQPSATSSINVVRLRWAQ